MRKIRLGTRGSRLALAQVEEVRGHCEGARGADPAECPPEARQLTQLSRHHALHTSPVFPRAYSVGLPPPVHLENCCSTKVGLASAAKMCYINYARPCSVRDAARPF